MDNIFSFFKTMHLFVIEVPVEDLHVSLVHGPWASCFYFESLCSDKGTKVKWLS